MKISNKCIFTMSLLFFATSLSAQDDRLVDLSGFYAEEIQIAGFTLDSDQTISIEAATISPRRNYREFHFSYAWILNSDSREIVWELTEADLEDRVRYKATYTDEKELAAGTYEVYYSTYPHFNFNDDAYFHWGARGFFLGIFNALFDDEVDNDQYKFFEDLYDELYFYMEGSGTALSAEDIENQQTVVKKKAFISFTSLRDDQSEEQIFRVIEPVQLHIYALGEAERDEEYDFGAIINLKTRERVWRLSYRDSEDAGGARKNRLSRQVIQLEPGIYQAIYVTDDSHSYRHWNSAPPFDPLFWGMTVWVESPGTESTMVKLDTADELTQASIVEFSEVRNEKYLSQGFTLKNPLDLHIYALGEGKDGDMYDYGWIIDSKTREKVWEMKYRYTEPGGGSNKNRLFDGIVRLEPGNYMVYYMTDDSHAYRDWNESPPYDKKSWGISISVMDDNYHEGDVIEYVEEDDPFILARLVRIRDDERKKSRFTMDKDGLVQIYALGEGSHGEMYDYAWIENVNNGRVVWEMTYRKTERAGGAKKNRLFDDRIHLEAGEYVVYYESDDSHAFNDWNARPPHDPFNWGITVSLAEE
jgi:hypothetical protein